MAERHGISAIDLTDASGADVPAQLRDRTDGRGPDAVLDAVGMEAHGGAEGAIAKAAQTAVGLLPDKVAQKVMETGGVDRLWAVRTAVDAVRRGGTISLSGVYGGEADPMPMMTMFDKQLQLRMGQCNVKAWIDDLLPLVEDPADPLGVMDLTTHRVPLEDAPDAYAMFQAKDDGCIKVVLEP